MPLPKPAKKGTGKGRVKASTLHRLTRAPPPSLRRNSFPLHDLDARNRHRLTLRETMNYRSWRTARFARMNNCLPIARSCREPLSSIRRFTVITVCYRRPVRHWRSLTLFDNVGSRRPSQL
jgi:hypothetical protein